MDLKAIREMRWEVEASPITEKPEDNMKRAQLLASWVIAEQLATISESLSRISAAWGKTE